MYWDDLEGWYGEGGGQRLRVLLLLQRPLCQCETQGLKENGLDIYMSLDFQ